ncbi:putative transmembrane anti-sigma factor [Mycolicibacterium flavescens]|uniref:anti-sigma factor family protein n=1 Tax=Mycobacterium neumannii TaxID=2048551 RepID=UPI000B93DF43|nr:zf-HC2 domain-containing protein [Mycobacterium neumannii]VEG45005.1 putative transmembrane anti-sigma factor [Mycolicibacterium flavescens]
MTAFEPVLGRADDDRYATWDAAYVLGSLTEQDRREYEAHLATCERCTAAVAELRDISTLLSTVEPAEFDGHAPAHPEPPPELLSGLLDRVRARRRRSRWMTSAAIGLAAAVLALGIAIAVRPEAFGLQTATPPQASGQQLEMAKVSETPINATISMTGYGWGTRIDMACTYGDWGQRDAPPQNLGMVVVGHDGSRNQVATWLGLSGATALPSATTPMQMDEIAAVQLVSPDSGEVLLERSL